MSTPTDLMKRLARTATTARTEADIQSDIKALLLAGDFDLDAPRLEEQVGDGTRRRIDIAAGATVIEVKKQLTTEDAGVDYIDQLRGGAVAKSEFRLRPFGEPQYTTVGRSTTWAQNASVQQHQEMKIGRSWPLHPTLQQHQIDGLARKSWTPR